MRKAHSIGGRNAAHRLYCGAKAPVVVKQPLKIWRDDISLSKHLDDFKYIGESINEDKFVISGEQSTRSSIKGHDPAKDGIVARVFPAKTVDARVAGLTEMLGLLEWN